MNENLKVFLGSLVAGAAGGWIFGGIKRAMLLKRIDEQQNVVEGMLKDAESKYEEARKIQDKASADLDEAKRIQELTNEIIKNLEKGNNLKKEVNILKLKADRLTSY